MIDLQAASVEPTARRRRWIMPAVVATVALAGIVVGAALANRDDTPTTAENTSAQLADISQACTGWMDQQMTNGSMMGSRMWSDPDRMFSTCRAWMEANPSSDRPADWCDKMMTGMWPHINGDWGNWNEQMNGPMMGG
jgi:hypothetical protein